MNSNSRPIAIVVGLLAFLCVLAGGVALNGIDAGRELVDGLVMFGLGAACGFAAGRG